MAAETEHIEAQIEVCRRFDVVRVPADWNSIIGVSETLLSREMPFNGLRHPARSTTCGWYLWGGEEMSEADDFFKPMHVAHLLERCPEVVRYLGLPAGWRFLKADDYQDMWFDESLLSPT